MELSHISLKYGQPKLIIGKSLVFFLPTIVASQDKAFAYKNHRHCE